MGTGPLRLAALGCHAAGGVASVGMGVLYLTSSEFFGYHRDALGTDWAQLDTDLQVLLRVLLNVAGGGWLACGVAVLVLAAGPARRGCRWADAALPAVGLAAWGPTTWATVELTTRTEATAPWYGAGALALSFVVGSALAVLDRRRATGRSVR